MTLSSSALTCGAAVTLSVLAMVPQSDATFWISLVYQLVPRVASVSTLFTLNNRQLITGRSASNVMSKRFGATGTRVFTDHAASGIRVELETVHQSEGPNEYDSTPSSEKNVRIGDSRAHRDDFDRLQV